MPDKLAPEELLGRPARRSSRRTTSTSRRRGVRDPRSRAFPADQPFRGAPGCRPGNAAGGAPRRRADRVGGRDPDRPLPRRLRGGSLAIAGSSSTSCRPARQMLGGTGTHPWSPWHEQRIIDTPHYRRNDEILRWVVWRNNSFGLHVHVPSTAPIARCRSATTCGICSGSSSPSRRARRSQRASSRICIRCGARSSRALPALRDPGRLMELGAVRAVRPLPLRHEVDRCTRRCGGASVSPTRRWRSGSATRSPISATPGRRRPRLRPRALEPPARWTKASRCPFPAPVDRGELLAGDPLRPRRRLHRPRDGELCRQAEAD